MLPYTIALWRHRLVEEATADYLPPVARCDCGRPLGRGRELRQRACCAVCGATLGEGGMCIVPTSPGATAAPDGASVGVLDPMQIELAVKSSAHDAEEFGGAGMVAVQLLQDP